MVDQHEAGMLIRLPGVPGVPGEGRAPHLSGKTVATSPSSPLRNSYVCGRSARSGPVLSVSGPAATKEMRRRWVGQGGSSLRHRAGRMHGGGCS